MSKETKEPKVGDSILDPAQELKEFTRRIIEAANWATEQKTSPAAAIMEVVFKAFYITEHRELVTVKEKHLEDSEFTNHAVGAICHKIGRDVSSLENGLVRVYSEKLNPPNETSYAGYILTLQPMTVAKSRPLKILGAEKTTPPTPTSKPTTIQ